jgi:PIN domain nuclease of toxin-antitoxin system
VSDFGRVRRFDRLPISVRHALAAGELPMHHADPFDRMLVAQATLEGLTIATRDPAFRPYGVSLLEA